MNETVSYSRETVLKACFIELAEINNKFGISARVLSENLLFAFATFPGDDYQIAIVLRTCIDSKQIIYDMNHGSFVTERDGECKYLSDDTELLEEIADAAIAAHKAIGRGPTKKSAEIIRHIRDVSRNIILSIQYHE